MQRSVPRPETLVQRTSEVLRERFSRGSHGDTIPGEPRMASELMVSRGTLRKALDLLAAEGRISPARPGVRRRILSGATGSFERSMRTVGVLLPQPLDRMSVSTHHFFRDLESLLGSDGIKLSYQASLAAHHAHPGHLLETILAEQSADIWLIYEASKPMVEFFKAANVPLIVCGGPGADDGISHCCFDGVAAQRHAIGTLARAGHTQIVTATRYPRPFREMATREEFTKRGWDFDPAIHMPLWNNRPEELHRLVHSRMTGHDRPTAWIINSLEGLVVFFSSLLELGLRIPTDVSLLTIGSDSMLGCFRPSISHYATPHRLLARAMARMVRNHLESPPSRPVIQLLQTEFVRGGSVGSAQG